MVNEEIVGTDVDMNWELNAEGDLSTVSGSDNISQGIFLRLTAYFDSLWWCYRNYGSYLKDWLGKIQNPYTHSTLLNEVLNRTLEDPRVDDAEVELMDWDAYYIGLRIKVWVQNKSYEEYFIFGNLPRKNENVYHSDYRDTYIVARREYYVKPGNRVRIHCHVCYNPTETERKAAPDETREWKVPIGEISLRIGGYLIECENNPQELTQNGVKSYQSFALLNGQERYDPGSVTFDFIVPPFVNYGDHDLVFNYKGIRGYNPCTFKAVLHVVNTIPTNTHYIYPKGRKYNYYYANDVDDFTDPRVFVNDYNDDLVDHGEVRYYLEEGDLDGKYMIIPYPLIFLSGELLHEQVYIKMKDTILDCSKSFVFELNRMFNHKDRITVTCNDGKVLDYLEVNYKFGIYFLTSTELIFVDKPYFTENSNIILKVIE